MGGSASQPDETIPAVSWLYNFYIPMMLDIFSYSSCGFDYVWHQQCIYG